VLTAGTHRARPERQASTSPPATLSPRLTLRPPAEGFLQLRRRRNFAVSVSDPEDVFRLLAGVIQPFSPMTRTAIRSNQYWAATARVATSLSTRARGTTTRLCHEAFVHGPGRGGGPPADGRAQVILQPKHKQAEFIAATGSHGEAGHRHARVRGLTTRTPWWAAHRVSSRTAIGGASTGALNNITGLTIRGRRPRPAAPRRSAAIANRHAARHGPDHRKPAWQTFRDFRST